MINNSFDYEFNSDLFLPEEIKEDILSHAIAEYPKECCGVLFKKGKETVYARAINSSQIPEQTFVIKPLDFVKLCKDHSDKYVAAIVHSHPNQKTATLSKADLSLKNNLPYHVILVALKVKNESLQPV